MTIFPPKKHSPKDAMTDFTPCPKTIRLCIEALPKDHNMARTEAWENGFQWCRSASRRALEALLPAEPAEAMVRDFIGSDYDDPHIDTDVRMVRLIRHLINQGKVRP